MLFPAIHNTKVIVLHAPAFVHGEMYRHRASLADFVRDNLRHYTIVGSFLTDAPTAEAAAEEVFDMTNNPSRQDERAYLYGNIRSLSVGDIVTYQEEGYEEATLLCDSIGWTRL